jgi:hypothetical protein
MLNFKLTAQDGFVLAHLDGLVSLDAWNAVLQGLARALPENAAPARLLIDMRAVLGYLGVPERTAVGALMAKHLARMEKVAVLVEAHKITQVVYDEAQRNGLDLRLFPKYEEAVAWVIS